MALVAVGVIVSYVTLRRLPSPAEDQPRETTREQVEEAAAAELAR